MKIINLNGIVGYEITDRLVSSLLAKYSPEDVTININSYGGEVFEAFAIYNSLISYAGNVTTVIKGVAASAASMIFLAGSKRAVYQHSTFMAHEPWMITIGEGDLLISRGEMLNGIRDVVVADLAEYMSKTKNAIKKDLKNEIWLVGWEQIAGAGIADELLDGDADESETVDTEPETREAIAAKIKNIMEKIRADAEAKAEEDRTAKIAASLEKLNSKSSPRNEGEEIKAEEKHMNKDELKAKFPDLYNELIDEGKKAANVETAVTEAIEKERTNAKEVLDLAGVSKEIAERATSGMDAGEFAKAELAKQRKAREEAARSDSGLQKLGAGAQVPADSAPPETENEIKKKADAWDKLYDQTGNKEAK